jgi:hypothetical protein
MTKLRYRDKLMWFGNSMCFAEWLEKLEDGKTRVSQPKVLKEVHKDNLKPCRNCGKQKDGKWQYTFATTPSGNRVLVRVSVTWRGEELQFCCENCLDEWLDKSTAILGYS